MKWGVETKVPLWYHETLQGTIDFWALEPELLTVVDYKSGRVEVDPYENPQGIIYSIGLMDKLGVVPKTTRIGILQPFSGGFFAREPKWWSFGADDVSFFRQSIANLARETQDALGRARLVPGDKQCRYCPAKPHCPAIDELLRTEMVGDPAPLTEAQLFAVLERMQSYEGFLEGVKERIHELPIETVEKYGWTFKRGARKFEWAKEEAAIVQYLTAAGINPFKMTLKTPSMVRDELGSDEKLEGWYETEYKRSSLQRKRS